MKSLKAVLAIALSTVGVGSGVAFGVANFSGSVIEKTKAETVSSSLIVKLGNIGKWSEDGAKIAAYLTDDSSNYWSDLQTLTSSKNIYKIDYSISFTPTKLIFVRMNPAATSGNWNQKWNQTGDLAFKEATYLQDQWDPSTSQCSQWTLTASVRSNEVESFGTKTTLSSIGLNSSGNPEVSGYVSLNQNEEFKVLAGDGVWSGYYGRPDALSSYFEGGSLTGRADNNPNIKCLVAGTYEFFFDTETKRIWITRKDIVDADGFADYFLKNLGCDETGATEPTGWATLASTYSNLSSEAKDVLYNAVADVNGDNIARCVYWYDYALRAHSGLTKFMVNSSGNPRALNTNIIESINGNTYIIVITVMSIIGITSIGLTFYFKKRKHQ